ncbi:ABC transporter permease [Carnobacterium gallinarum]|uniref:ABC transporter permease n=1 Tax=Carnobacterium gallinarum TaxID=2749 RepID=UPI00054DFE9B|nr:ABC transporter permease [Carnobacterium gallinarum]
MSNVSIIIKEQLKNARFIFSMARYEEKATYQNHYLGLLWQILNPLMQIGIYYLIFGLGIRGGRSINGVPYILWMLIGLIPWLYINSSLLGASKSIYRQVDLASKMKFPVSILPTINLVSNLTIFLPMGAVVLFFLIQSHFYPTIYWLQLIYYFFCMVVFLYSVSLLNATITTLVRDYQLILQSAVRILFYVSGTIWDFETKGIPEIIIKVLRLNPFYYIINGFRDSLIFQRGFWENGTITLIFWLTTFVFLILGSQIHLKFRAKFMDIN